MQNVKRNEQAVSPVIGVILMVVITVIIAAVLAVFAFGVGAPTKSPTASVKITSVDPVSDVITVQHYGGDTLRLKDVKITVETLDGNGVIQVPTAVLDVASGATGQFSAGDTLAIDTTTAVPTLKLNGATAIVTLDATSTGSVTLAGADSVRVTVIDTPSGSVMSKPSAKIS